MAATEQLTAHRRTCSHAGVLRALHCGHGHTAGVLASFCGKRARNEGFVKEMDACHLGLASSQ
eukprot:3046400-Prymnesium_polylepis.1